jgi:hypothetical protein
VDEKPYAVAMKHDDLAIDVRLRSHGLVIPRRFCDPLGTAFNVTGNRDMPEFAAKEYIVRLNVT